jgi:N-formylmaleamate deformylase
LFKYTQGDVKINGIKIHYYRAGGGKPPFILLHGATDNGLCWTPVAELLAAQYDVIMPDAQGHGFSDRLGRDFVFHDHARQVLGLIRELGLSKPIIMGHSMGAGTTVNIAAEHSDRLKAIVLEDPGWHADEPVGDQNVNENAMHHEEFIKSLLEYNKRTKDELIAECRKDNPRWSEAEILPWADAKLQFDPALFTEVKFIFPSYVDLVPQINCPTLLIISDGGIVSAATARHAAELWKSDQPFRRVQIKGAGHNIRREQFEAYRETLFGFLGEIEKAGG